MTDELLDYGRTILGDLAEDEPGALRGRMRVKPVRSALYLPGNRRDFIQKCHRYGSDAVVIDLEDAVQPSDREAARRIISEEIGPLSQRVGAVWVRVNPGEADMLADLDAVVRPGLATIQLSKVFGPEDIIRLDRALGYFEGRHGLARQSVSIAPLLETANGVRQAYAIAMASPRIEYMGGVLAPEGDTARALRMRVMSDPVGTELLHLRGQILTDARSAGLRCVVGGVVVDLAPEQDLLRSFAKMNRNIGYSGMLVIHPSHVAAVNEIFSPSPDELLRARRILQDVRSSAGRGAIRGPNANEMIDLAMVRFAVLLLEEAAELGITVPDPELKRSGE